MPEISVPLQVLLYALTSLFSAAFAAGGAYWAVRVKMAYMEKAIDENKNDIKALRADTKTDFTQVHDRISRVAERNRLAANGGSGP